MRPVCMALFPRERPKNLQKKVAKKKTEIVNFVAKP